MTGSVFVRYVWYSLPFGITGHFWVCLVGHWGADVRRKRWREGNIKMRWNDVKRRQRLTDKHEFWNVQLRSITECQGEFPFPTPTLKSGIIHTVKIKQRTNCYLYLLLSIYKRVVYGTNPCDIATSRAQMRVLAMIWASKNKATDVIHTYIGLSVTNGHQLLLHKYKFNKYRECYLLEVTLYLYVCHEMIRAPLTLVAYLMW